MGVEGSGAPLNTSPQHGALWPGLPCQSEECRTADVSESSHDPATLSRSAEYIIYILVQYSDGPSSEYSAIREYHTGRVL